MQKIKNRILAISIAILLTISISASIMLTPPTTAHSPPWQIPTYAYVVAAPNPIGVGQEAHVYMWLDVFTAQLEEPQQLSQQTAQPPAQVCFLITTASTTTT